MKVRKSERLAAAQTAIDNPIAAEYNEFKLSELLLIEIDNERSGRDGP